MPDKSPFNQTRSYPTWREADSLPYSGLSKNLLHKLRFHDQIMKTDNQNSIYLYYSISREKEPLLFP